MATERVQKPIWQPSSQKKQSPIVPPLINSQTEADSLSSPKLPVSGVKSKAERDAIRRSLFEKWAGAAPQQMSASEVLGHGGLSTETDTIQGQEASEAKDQMGMPIQAKLTIGKPGDKYEQEADRVAAQVVNQINAPTPPQPVQSQSVQREAIPEEDELQMKPEAGIMQREEMLESEEELQMKPMVQLQPSTGGMTATSDLETSIQQARGSGQSLADTIRQPMEQAFGADFSSVKVHTDTQSDLLNQSIQARAFTTGQDIFFRSGEYKPGSRGGQELIAHELTHVVQQNGSADVVHRDLDDEQENKIQQIAERWAAIINKDPENLRLYRKDKINFIKNKLQSGDLVEEAGSSRVQSHFNKDGVSVWSSMKLQIQNTAGKDIGGAQAELDFFVFWNKGGETLPEIVSVVSAKLDGKKVKPKTDRGHLNQYWDLKMTDSGPDIPDLRQRFGDSPIYETAGNVLVRYVDVTRNSEKGEMSLTDFRKMVSKPPDMSNVTIDGLAPDDTAKPKHIKLGIDQGPLLAKAIDIIDNNLNLNL